VSTLVAQGHRALLGGPSGPPLEGESVLLIRFALLVLAVVAAAVVAFVADAAWLLALALVLLVALTAGTVLLVVHYTGSPEWLGGEDQAELDRAGLVESESGLPKRRRYSERRAEEYAAEVSRRGLVAVPDGWRGPDGAHRVLLIATAPVAPDVLLRGLPDPVPADQLAVLVVVPTLAQDERHFRLADASEAVAHAEGIARDTVTALRSGGIHVAGHIGPADPAVALADGLRTYAAERVIALRAHSGARRYLEDEPLEQAARTFGVPLTELAPEPAG
jgi:hypothetical protein